MTRQQLALWAHDLRQMAAHLETDAQSLVSTPTTRAALACVGIATDRLAEQLHTDAAQLRDLARQLTADTTSQDETPPPVAATLTADDLDMILAALDSHIYWQLSEDDNRNDGSVIEDTPEIVPFRELETRLSYARYPRQPLAQEGADTDGR